MLPTYLINLPRRTDRLEVSKRILQQHGIDFELCEAIALQNGADGIRQTMIGLFTHILQNTDYDKVLILEDDVDFIELNSSRRGNYRNVWMQIQLAMSELPPDFDLLFLGANVYKPLLPYSKNLLKLTGAVANHAIIYTRKAMAELLELYTNNPKSITDSLMDTHIVSRGTCYIMNPMIAVQRPDFSDIEGKPVNYKRYIQDRFNNAVKKLKL